MTDDPKNAWEAWQDEYQHGAFVLFPADRVAVRVNELRARFDPKSAAICDAHVSLSEPLVRPLSDRQVAELRSVLANVVPFELTYGPLTSSEPHPGIVFAITPESAFFALRAIVQST